MTKQELIELTGQSVYTIWLEMALRHFNQLDPEAGFILAEAFVKELLLQNPKF